MFCQSEGIVSITGVVRLNDMDAQNSNNSIIIINWHLTA